LLATISSHSRVFAAEESSNNGKVAQESSNAGNAAQESSNSGNTESNNHPLCLNEHTEKWETCVVKNSPQKHESSKTGISLSNTERPSTFSLSNTRNAEEKANNTGQSSAPVRPPITITHARAHITTTQLVNNKQLSSKLTEKTPITEEQLANSKTGKGLRSLCSLLRGILSLSTQSASRKLRKKRRG